MIKSAVCILAVSYIFNMDEYIRNRKDTENSRNGHSRKTMKTSAGEVEIAVPRDRNGVFETRLEEDCEHHRYCDNRNQMGDKRHRCTGCCISAVSGRKYNRIKTERHSGSAKCRTDNRTVGFKHR